MAAVALVALLAMPAALASHMSLYLTNPVEHDDLGRSDEPNFAGTTSLLGLPLEERNVDVTLAGIGQHHEPDGQALAPGCTHTDEHGNNVRDRSGMCGLYTIGVGLEQPGDVLPPGKLGDPPTAGDGAPGRFTPTKGSAVQFLDARQDAEVAPPVGGTSMVDVNHALADNGVAALLAQQGLGGQVVGGPVALWAWFGTWRDLNGNGVIDAQQLSCDPDENGAPDCGARGGQGPGNEFVWLGKCTDANGHDGPANLTQCQPMGVDMPDWIVPGNHHAICFALTIDLVGAECQTPLTGGGDAPGRQVLCFADILLLGPIGLNGAVPATCPNNDGSLADLDEFDQDNAGDPLLGPQDSVRVDDLMADRTGDPSADSRLWLGGTGWPTYFYDNGLLVTTTIVTGATSQTVANLSLDTRFDLRSPAEGGPMRFLDVDRVRALSPLTDSLLQSTLKPLARGAWLQVRAAIPLVERSVDPLANNRLL